MYKSWIVVYALFFINMVAIAQDERIQIKFEDSSWSSLLEKAKASDQLIFVDVYTNWCGPCKTMSKEVFTDPTIATFYNDKFINAHINAEEGEGLSFARKYRIQAYPSLLFINGSGEVVHRATGFHDVDEFRLLGETAVSPTGGLLEWNRLYREGERSPAFLQKLILAKYNAMEEDCMEVAEAYMRSQKDWSTLPNMQLIFNLIEDPASSWFDYMVDHREDFDLLFGREAVASKLQSLFLKKPLGKTGNPMKEVDQFYAKVYPDMAPKLSAHFKMNYFRTIGNMKAFAEAADQYMSTYASTDPNELNNIAWTFFEYVEDLELLMKAVSWAEQSVALAPGYHNLDTLAHLFYKMGKRSKARKAAKQAIALATAEGVTLHATQALLDRLNGR